MATIAPVNAGPSGREFLAQRWHRGGNDSQIVEHQEQRKHRRELAETSRRRTTRASGETSTELESVAEVPAGELSVHGVTALGAR
jgi:hypothetical protein